MKFTDNAKKGITVTLIACAVVFVVFYAIVNIGAVSSVLTSVLAVFTPVIIGFAIAYMLNPILCLFEFKVFKKISKKNVLRALSIICTYVVALLIVVAFFWLIIPSLIDAVKDLISNYDDYIAKTSDIINNVINWFMKNESVAEYVNDAAIKEMIAAARQYQHGGAQGTVRHFGRNIVQIGGENGRGAVTDRKLEVLHERTSFLLWKYRERGSETVI